MRIRFCICFTIRGVLTKTCFIFLLYVYFHHLLASQNCFSLSLNNIMLMNAITSQVSTTSQQKGKMTSIVHSISFKNKVISSYLYNSKQLYTHSIDNLTGYAVVVVLNFFHNFRISECFLLFLPIIL